MKRVLAVVLISASVLAQTSPATHPGFTIGKETTVVNGPLKPDGTIDYLPAINALLAKDAKNEDNAAIPLLLLQAGVSKDGTIEPRLRQSLAALHAAIPEKVERSTYLSDYAARQKGVDMIPEPEGTRLAELAERLFLRPWKAQDQPLAVEWLVASAGALKLAEDASRRSKFFIPFLVPAEKSIVGLEGSAVEAQPPVSIMMLPTRLLLSRAQMRAGAGNVAAALADVHATRNLGRVVEQEHFGLLHLMSLATEYNALRACAGMAVSGTLTREQLQAVRQEILSLPVISDEDPAREQVEEFIALDLAMQCIAGKSLAVMRMMALDFSGTAKIDLSDWKNADWDVMLRETVRLQTETVPGDTFLEHLQNWEKKSAKEPQGPSLLDNLESLADDGTLATVTQRVNAFLKRNAGESRDDYTRRITRWLMGADLADVRRNLGLNERTRMTRVLALTCVALAEYRLANGAYPESLEKLAPAPEHDGFTGKPLHYRRQGEGFTLWSAGLNQTDDGGTKDDLVVGTEVGK
jgi:hypothetical protein